MVNVSSLSGIPASFETALEDVCRYLDALYKSQGGFLYSRSGYLTIKEIHGTFPVYIYNNYPKSMKNIKYIVRYGHAAEGISKRV